VLAFVACLTTVGSAWADHDHKTVKSVPELGTTGAAAGIALIAGAGAIALGRRRGRKS
jgi:hypothetical protein